MRLNCMRKSGVECERRVAELQDMELFKQPLQNCVLNRDDKANTLRYPQQFK